MTNVELTDFKFVDRKKERKEACEYLHKDTKSVLAVFGKSSAGKNFFIDQLQKENKSFTYFCFNFKEQNINPIKYMIKVLYECNNSKFMQFIKRNYKKIIKSSTIIVDSLAKTNFTELYDCLSEKDCSFLGNDDYKDAPYNIICKYIKKVSKKNKVVVVLKDITSCEKAYIHDLFKIIAVLYDSSDTNVRFIMSCDEKIYNNEDIFSSHFNKLQRTPIIIEKFKDSKYFLEILKEIFDITAKDKSYLEHLFNICEGYPGQLRDLLNLVYNKHFKTFSGQSKVRFDEDIFEESIKEINQIEELKPIEQSVLIIALFINHDFTYNQFIDICSSVYYDKPTESMRKLVEDATQDLINSKGLLRFEYLPSKDLDVIRFNNNLNKDSYIQACQSDEAHFAYLSNHIYTYITNCNDFKSDLDKYNINCAFFSWKANRIDWVQINYKAGIYFFNKNELSLAENILIRLINQLKLLNEEQIYNILSCFYSTGNYSVALDIISSDCTKAIEFYEYDLLKVKILSINMKKNEAIELLEKLLANNQYGNKYYSLLDIKQRILSNIKGKRTEAKTIFDELNNKYLTKKSNYNDFLISAMEYYRGETVQNSFKILDAKFRKDNEQVMLGELLTNKGFDLFWQGKIQEARKSFSEAIDLLERLKIHETSYVLNNYANCLMMLGDYENAIESLNSALLFNESDYAEITIKTNLMVCYAICKDDDYKKYFKELEKYLQENKNKNIDISISLKVKYALGFAQRQLNIKCENDYCGEAIIEALAEDGNTIPYLWFKNWREDIETDILSRLNFDTYKNFYELRFEPWLLTITHD